jgi:hypothetical protein
MGAHYTRHVEAEVNIIRAFSRIAKNVDLEVEGQTGTGGPPVPPELRTAGGSEGAEAVLDDGGGPPAPAEETFPSDKLGRAASQ